MVWVGALAVRRTPQQTKNQITKSPHRDFSPLLLSFFIVLTFKPNDRQDRGRRLKSCLHSFLFFVLTHFVLFLRAHVLEGISFRVWTFVCTYVVYNLSWPGVRGSRLGGSPSGLVLLYGSTPLLPTICPGQISGEFLRLLK